ncbi:MAG: hypothetical protein PVJ46_10150 [Methyloceanibacter sp.]|jgi:hypothetical protein
MASKPNYNFQKAERDRAKARKKQEKLRRLQEETEKRKGTQDGDEMGANTERRTDDA